MRQFICYIRKFSLEHNLQQLQNLYDDLSPKIVNIPELSSLLDAIYYSLDYPSLLKFRNDLETKGTSITDNIIYIHTENDPYGELSNSYPSPFTLNEILYPTVEHYFQAQKFINNTEYFNLILSQTTPNKAKILGNKQIKN